MWHRRTRRGLLAAGLAVAFIVALPSVAHAATVLPANAPVVSASANGYSFTTTLQYWTAVAVRPEAGVDYDLQVVDQGTGAPLASSVWAGGATDVIAINSTGGFRPLGGYLANVTKYSGNGRYSIMFWEQRVVMPVPTDPIGGTATAVSIKFDQPVAARQIYLFQGQGFRINHGTSTAVFLAGSTPGQPSTYLRNRSALANANVIADNVASPGGAVCRVFAAPANGWYSLILIWTTPWTPPPYNGGHAVFPQRYDPNLGDKLTDCPNPKVP